MTEEKILELSHLSVGIKKDKGTFLAVRDISLHVNAGEIVGIVGESGCGKSLAALSIPGLLGKNISITNGEIFLQNRNITGLPEKEMRKLRGLDISFIFQEPESSLNPLMKIKKQIAEPLKLHGEKNREVINEKTAEVMEQTGLTDTKRILNAYPHQLSGGQRQRVMIASAIICKPKLLICDEPTTALDAGIQMQILDLLRKLNRELDVSILFISHDLGVINRLCNRVYVMYAGRIVENGTVRDIFENPAHEYTKGLIASIPRREDKGKALKSIGGKVPSIEEIGNGCPFAPRCSEAQGICRECFPNISRLGKSHSVSCFSFNGNGGV